MGQGWDMQGRLATRDMSRPWARGQGQEDKSPGQGDSVACWLGRRPGRDGAQNQSYRVNGGWFSGAGPTVLGMAGSSGAFLPDCRHTEVTLSHVGVKGQDGHGQTETVQQTGPGGTGLRETPVIQKAEAGGL